VIFLLGPRIIVFCVGHLNQLILKILIFISVA
jgi:hypothetical protein